MFETLIQDLRYSIRSLFARPGFVFAAVATLALGIGANTAIFSVVNGLLLKPLPYDDGERLVQVFNVYPKNGLEYAGTSIPDYLDRKEQAAALEDLALYTGQSYNLALEGRPERLVGLRATPSLFTTLRAQPALGRAYTDAEAVPGADQVAVLSHATWQAQFAADPEIIGRDIRLNGVAHRVIGVMPESFAFPNRTTQLWVPFAFRPEQKVDDERGNEYSESIGRLKPGASVEQLNSQMDAIVMRNAERFAGAGERGVEFAEFIRQGGFVGRAKSLREQWVGELRPVLWMLQAVVGFVLLIACANVANLMLTRVAGRQKELSVRTALGAGRGRIARQLLVEALLLALLGGIGGIVLAYLSLDLLQLLGLSRSRLADQVGIDGQVLAFTLAVALLTGVVFGLFPALAQLGGKPYEVLKDGGRGNTGGRGARATRNVLVVVQMALAVTLLVGAGLLIRSFQQVADENPGFTRDGLLTVRLDLPSSKYPEPPDQARLFERALSELRAVPGVTEAAYVSNLPFGQSNWTSSYDIEGMEQAPGEPSPHGFARIVDEDFFKAMGIPVLQGRVFTATDTRDSPKVMVIDEVLARKYFPNGDAIGKRIERGDGDDDNPEFWTIIGVVGTIKNLNLADEVKKESYYFSFRQYNVPNGFFVVRSGLPTGGLVQPVRDAVLRADPEQPVYDIRTLDERIAISLEGRRAPMVLLALFSAVALLLAAIGIYGVLAFAVAQRTGELGVRMAIGAQRGDIVSMVLRQGARLVSIGLGIGIVAALVGGRALSAQLYGVGATDPVTLVAVVGLLAAVAFMACWLPARRAAGTDPIVALRHE
ncbi:MAG: ABC transporter permease [Xanthomonadales bacterium]|nr:ABC transporter permease [Xanthomonadales bacterium]